jgi:hypothetical protein
MTSLENTYRMPSATYTNKLAQFIWAWGETLTIKAIAVVDSCSLLNWSPLSLDRGVNKDGHLELQSNVRHRLQSIISLVTNKYTHNWLTFPCRVLSIWLYSESGICENAKDALGSTAFFRVPSVWVQRTPLPSIIIICFFKASFLAAVLVADGVKARTWNLGYYLVPDRGPCQLSCRNMSHSAFRAS